MTPRPSLTFGDLDDRARPLAVLVHGFPDTPHTWRHLGPALADDGYRVVAPWLPGYDEPLGGPLGVGHYVRAIAECRAAHGGGPDTLLVGHDWGANACYGAAALHPEDYAALVTLAVPPTGAIGPSMFGHRQLKRSFYIWFIQQPGLAEGVFCEPGFFEDLWADWSPGHDGTDDVARFREAVGPESIAGVLSPYRATFDPSYTDPGLAAEADATMADPPIPTLYLHGADDGALGPDVLLDVQAHLSAPGSVFELVERAGHFLHLERPERIAELVGGWIGQTVGAPAR